MNSEANTQPTRKLTHRRILYGLLGAFVLTVLLVVLAVGLPIYLEQRAAREFEQLGGRVTWKNELHAALFGEDEKSWERQVFGDRIGRYFDSVDLAFYDGGHQDINTVISMLSHFRNLHSVAIHDPQLTDEHMADISQLKTLEVITLDGTNMTGIGIRDLTSLPNLLTLDLANTKITDESLKELKKLDKLQGLSLASNNVTNEGIWELRTLKSLQTLVLSNTRITEEGVRRLQAELPNLEVWDD